MSYSLDDIWLDGRGRWKGLTRRESRRAYRVFIVLMVGVNYLIDTSILYLFYLNSTTELRVVLFYGLAAAGHVLLFSTLAWSGFSERFSDSHLTFWQMFYAIIVMFTGIAIAPQLIVYFLAFVFVVFGFAALRISFRYAILSWLLCCLLLAFIVQHIAPVAVVITISTMSEITLSLLVFATVLLRLIGLGYYGTMLRIRSYKQAATLEGRVNIAEKLATHDALTNTYNRRFMIPAIDELTKLCKRKGIPSCVAMIDLDRFKRINDTYGHLVGDTVLKTVADRMLHLIRDTDKLGRYGGEEFILVMPFTSLEDATQIVERIRKEIAKVSWKKIEPTINITISCGITEVTQSDTSQEVIKRADDALIKAKNDGRNRTYYLSDTGACEIVGPKKQTPVT